MKPELLNDVLSEGDYSAFRDRLRDDFRAKVGRRAHRSRILLAMAASIALIGAILFYPRSHQSQIAAVAPVAQNGIAIFETSPLKPEEIISGSFTPFTTIETHVAAIMTIVTLPNAVETVNDAELLASFPDHPVGLIAGAGGRKLVFIDPADAKRFMSSN